MRLLVYPFCRLVNTQVVSLVQCPVKMMEKLEAGEWCSQTSKQQQKDKIVSHSRMSLESWLAH